MCQRERVKRAVYGRGTGSAPAEPLQQRTATDRAEEGAMRAVVALWSVILLCFSLAAAIGGGLYESIVLTPIWSRSPPASFSIIQPETGVALQRLA